MKVNLYLYNRIIVYYNPNTDNFYYKFIRTNHPVGYINQYDHIVVNRLAYDSNKKCYVSYTTSFYESESKENKKNVLINRIIGFLDKLKD